MPAMISELSLRLIHLSEEEERKSHSGLVDQLKKELEKVRPFKVYEELDLMLSKLEVKEETKISPRKESEKMKADKLEKMKQKQLKYIENHEREEKEETQQKE